MVFPKRFLSLNTIFILSVLLLKVTFCFAQLPTGYSVNQVQSGYVNITGAIFNTDGTQMFTWEKSGHVYVSNWDGMTYVRQDDPVLDISDEVGDWGEFGLLGFCLDPNYETNGLVYLYYTVDREHLTSLVDCDDANSLEDCENNPPSVPSPYDPDDNDYMEATISRLTRYELNIESSPLTTDYSSRTILIGESPSTGIPSTHRSHAGGTIIFGDDGTLLLSVGDHASFSSLDDGSTGNTYYLQALADGILRPEENVGAFRSQMITSLCGKILRIDPATGNGVPSNPFYDTSNPQANQSKVWAMGLRQPFRISIQKGSGSTNPEDGNPGILFVADVGWGEWEELHIFDKGGLNGGWPLYEGLLEHVDYFNIGATNPEEGDALFSDNCVQPTSFVDDNDPALRRFVHNRPEVAWRHGAENEARVPWFDGTIPTNPRVGSDGSPTTGVEFRGNTAISGVLVQGNALGSSLNGKYMFADFVRNWINIATLTDGNLNWISDITEFAPAGFGEGIVHMVQNPLDGFVYYVNIYDGTIMRLSFEGPSWIEEPTDITLQCNSVTDPIDEFNEWLDSFSGSVLCGTATITNDNSGLNILCGNTVSETVIFTLTDECGNQISKSASFIIEDVVNPIWDEAPSDLAVSCDEDYQLAYDNWLSSFSGTDNCSDTSIVHNGPSTIECEDSVTVSFELMDACGNSIIAEATFAVELDLSLTDHYDVDIKILPNPTDGSIYFEGIRESSVVEIYNILGKLQLKTQIDNSSTDIDLNLNSGIYLLKISSGNHISIKKLIVK